MARTISNQGAYEPYGAPLEPAYRDVPPRDPQPATTAQEPYGAPLEPAPAVPPKRIAPGTYPSTPPRSAVQTGAQNMLANIPPAVWIAIIGGLLLWSMRK